MTKDPSQNGHVQKQNGETGMKPSYVHSKRTGGSERPEPLSVVDIAAGEEYWYADFDTFPAVIAHEYYRLRELCIKDKPYGVLLQIKDMYEILLKFEILVLCAWAREKKLDAFFQEVGCDITTPRLSLGGWVYIGSQALKYFRKNPEEKLPESIQKPLDQILAKYQEHNIVNWRNQHVGHGATGFSDDIHYLESIVEHLNHFKDVFGSIGVWLSMQQLMLEDKALQGHAHARNLESGGKVSLVLTDVRTTLDLNPFICLLEDTFTDSHLYSLYSYDSQNGRLRASDMLSYPSGEKRVEKYGYFSEIDEVRQNKTQGDKHKSLSTNIRQIDEKMINQLWTDSMFYPFVEPKAVAEWLREGIDQEKSGIFFLQMERGMGKSTFCERIHGLNNLPYMIDQDTDVRVLHMERGRSSAPVYFEMAIENLWRQAYEADENWLTQRPISFFREEGQNRLESLLKFLAQCQEYTYTERGKDKILFVIDGLDEIAQDEIWQYIPTEPITMPDNVYLLLTSRSTAYDDLPSAVTSHLNAVFSTRQMVVHRKSEQYTEFLHQFILQTPLKTQNHDQEWFDRIIELADDRVLHLSLICKLLESGLTLESLQTFSDIVRIYLEKLEEMYGAKEAEKLRELITIIAVFSGAQPVSLQEIADMSWEKGAVTADLLGKISDLSPLLHIWHNGSVHRGSLIQNNLFSFANPDVRDRLLSLLPWKDKYISDLRNISYEYIRQCVTDGKITDGSFAVTVLKLIAFDYLSEDWNTIFSRYQLDEEQLFRFLSLDLPYLDQHSRPSAIQILDRMAERTELQKEAWKTQSEMLIFRGNLERDQQVYEKARETLQHAETILRSVKNYDSPEWLLLKIQWDDAMYSLHLDDPEGRKQIRHLKRQIAMDAWKARKRLPQSFDALSTDIHLFHVQEQIQSMDGNVSFYEGIHNFLYSNDIHFTLALLGYVWSSKKVPKEEPYRRARYCILDGELALRTRRGKKPTKQNRLSVSYAEKMFRRAISILDDGCEDSSWQHEKKEQLERKLAELKAERDEIDAETGDAPKASRLKELNALILANMEKRLAFREYMQGLRLLESIPAPELQTLDEHQTAKFLDDCFYSRKKRIDSGILASETEVMATKIRFLRHKLRKAGLLKCVESVKKGWKMIKAASREETVSSSLSVAVIVAVFTLLACLMNRFVFVVFGSDTDRFSTSVIWILCLMMFVCHLTCKWFISVRVRNEQSVFSRMVQFFSATSQFVHLYISFSLSFLLVPHAYNSIIQLFLPIAETLGRGYDKVRSLIPLLQPVQIDPKAPDVLFVCAFALGAIVCYGLYFLFEAAGVNQQNELLIAKAIAMNDRVSDPKTSNQDSHKQSQMVE